MPREARLDYPGALQHVCLRGIERRVIFIDDEDREGFLFHLGIVLGDAGNPCLAWALMPNHVHLLVESRGAPLPRVMRRLGTRYAVEFNRRHGRAGHLFQNRYFSRLVEAEDYRLTAACYIHRNPLRAGIVPDLVTLESYPWTGYPALLGGRARAFQDVDGLLSSFGRDREEAQAVLRARMAEVEPPPPRWRPPAPYAAQLPLPAESPVRSGGEVPSGRSRAEALRLQGWDVDRLLRAVCETLGVSERDLRLGRRYPAVAQARAVVAHLGSEELGVPLAEIGRATGVGGSAISGALERGRRLAAEKGIGLQA